MQLLRISLFLILFSAFFSCQKEKPDSGKDLVFSNVFKDATLRRITDRQDERKTDSLLAYLKHENPLYREKAAWALASVQDTLALDGLLASLKDSSAQVVQASAFALGQLGHNKAIFFMSEIFEKQPISVKVTILEAIGKCALSEQDADFLAKQAFAEEELRQGQILGIYRAMTKGVSSPNCLSTAIAFLNPTLSESTRQTASYFLARNSKKENYANFYDKIAAGLGDPSPYVRMNLATALSAIAKPEAVKQLGDLLEKDSSELVRINAARALRNTKNAAVLNLLKKALFDPNPNVVISASDGLPLFDLPKDTTNWLVLAKKINNYRAKATVLSLAVGKDKNDEAANYVANLYNTTTNVYEKGFLLKALSFNKIHFNYSLIARELFKRSHPFISTEAMTALVTIRQNTNFVNLNEQVLKDYDSIFKFAIGSEDAALVAMAAEALRVPEWGYKDRFDMGLLIKAKEKLPLPQEQETLISLEKTIAFFAGREETQVPPPAYNHPIDWAILAPLSATQNVMIQTSKGNIMVELYVEKAPASVANFIELAKKGYFNGKSFHRIVPNFVVQGGCPRGDGYGSLDYSIRSEFAQVYYEAGTLGMASAGKDTEGCQWFITHSPTPHLDGRYTAFGKVILGLDIVQEMEIGDLITEVKVVGSQM